MSVVKPIVSAYPDFKRTVDTDDYLEVSEFYFDTIQGEGINLGFPAAFLRLQHCKVNCSFCDTREVWRHGNPYTFIELYGMMNDTGLVKKLYYGQHLVITGGSPLLQQDRLARFLTGFFHEFGFKPYTEIENECSIIPVKELFPLIDCWNNSPKLSNSKVPSSRRFNPLAIRTVADLPNAWFKFVIADIKDWKEIKSDFLYAELIHKRQILLMPQGETQQELADNREMVVELAIANNVRYCTREHIVLWDKKTGM